jgi:guanylate kinase
MFENEKNRKDVFFVSKYAFLHFCKSSELIESMDVEASFCKINFQESPPIVYLLGCRYSKGLL